MNRMMKYFSLSILIGALMIGALFIFQYYEIQRKNPKPSSIPITQVSKGMTNPVVYFEIPVTDVKRAMLFYKRVFGFSFEQEVIDNNQMALFPFSENASGISGALAKGETYVPAKTGTLVYFFTPDIDSTLAIVSTHGGKTLYPKTAIGVLGFVAEFEDSEGNRIALHAKK